MQYGHGFSSDKQTEKKTNSSRIILKIRRKTYESCKGRGWVSHLPQVTRKFRLSSI